MTRNHLLLTSSIVLAAAGLSSVAHADYSVSVSAESRGQINYGRGYNAGNYIDGEPGGPGFTFYGGSTCASGNYTSCTESGTGTVSSDPHLKAATEATSYDETTLPSGFFPQGLHAAGSAYATANLAGGSVGIADSGTYGLSGCCSGQDGGNGVSNATNDDLLHFAVAGATSQTMTVIGVTYRVHGGMDAFTPLGDSTGDLTAVFLLGNAFFEGREFANGSNNYTPVFSEAGQTGGWLTDYVTQEAPGEFTFHATYGLIGATQNLGIQENLEENCGGGTACDYAHTATVAFTLPSGVTFTSDSGVFLTQGVPEPATWAMMLVGVGGLGAMLRRRHKAVIEQA